MFLLQGVQTKNRLAWTATADSSCTTSTSTPLSLPNFHTLPIPDTGLTPPQTHTRIHSIPSHHIPDTQTHTRFLTRAPFNDARGRHKSRLLGACLGGLFLGPKMAQRWAYMSTKLRALSRRGTACVGRTSSSGSLLSIDSLAFARVFYAVERYKPNHL